MSNRAPGRYNLHRLGWSAFEDLCMQVLRVVLGETCTRFVAGPDGGRDGWFRGQAAGLLATQNRVSGNFLIQCKHTSIPHNALEQHHLRRERIKVEHHAQDEDLHYIIMTNRPISAQNEEDIRKTFEAIHGVSSCLVLGETWLEDTIDSNARLLRLVPRLYGIGDLSQILSFVIQQQTIAILEDLVHSLRTFVPTDSYRRAERALHDHRFVILVGPPASGKSAIAANLCMVNSAQDANIRILRIEQADQFKNTWSPSDAQTIYWVDDIFGETTLDDIRLREWSAALEKIEAARKRGARILFCTRDYILAAAERRLKSSKVDIINDARIRVDVTALSDMERDAILYNHIKDGDISKEQKRALKQFLSQIARLSSFSPELARRLGNNRFHKGLKYEWPQLEMFFKTPIQHFRDIIHGLSGSETAALAVCLLSNNSVPDPIPDDALSEAVLKTYGVSMYQIREAFELLEGSLVKRVRGATTQTWQVHHPSMIEALQSELAVKSSQLILYLQSAQLRAILRDTSTTATKPDSRLVFLPSHVYSLLIDRFHKAKNEELEAVADYITSRSSDELLAALNATYPEILEQALSIESRPDGDDIVARLAVQLHRSHNLELLGPSRQALAKKTIADSVTEWGWMGFLGVKGIEDALPGLVSDVLKSEIRKHFPSLELIYDWHSQNLSSQDDVDYVLSELDAHADRICVAANSAGLWSTTTQDEFSENLGRLQDRLHHKIDDIAEQNDAKAEYYQDEWKDRTAEDRYELERGRFSDVDE